MHTRYLQENHQLHKASLVIPEVPSTCISVLRRTLSFQHHTGLRYSSPQILATVNFLLTFAVLMCGSPTISSSVKTGQADLKDHLGLGTTVLSFIFP